ncbi:MAG: hypothetical protein JNM63_18420, partial [Spirochaetia bacterium]|nr:hypothetical protein [Spirochaetia bacterium]
MKISKLLFSLLLLPAFALAQGLVIETSMSGGPMMGDEVQTLSSMAVPKKFKTGLRKNEYVLVRLDKEMMIRVNTEKKTYMELTFNQLEEKRKAMMAQMGPQMEQMKAQMKNMPEEQRKMMEKMMANMGGASETKVDVKAAGDKLKIAGYDAVKYTFAQDGKEVASVWASKDTPEYANLKKDYTEFARRMGALNPGMSKSLNEAMQSIEGFPRQTIMANGMTIIVSQIVKNALADRDVGVPAGEVKAG